MMEIIEQVAKTIKEYELFSPEQRVVTGVSGGADSLCLLGCLKDLGYEVVVAHLDHQLRNESEEEAEFVKKIAKNLGLEWVTEKGDVQHLAEKGYSLEEAARLVRYRFLVRVAKDMGEDTISTGHTADDQIETVLMHFLRGSGPSGLRGMLYKTALEDWIDIPNAEGISLARPLLDVRHVQTEAYCDQMGITPIYDPSNQDTTFFRNRIRHLLIPFLKDFNPGIEEIILRMAKVMQAETLMIHDLLKEKWESIVLETSEDSLHIDRIQFSEMHIALQRSFIRRVIKVLKPDIRDLGFDHVERAIRFLTGKPHSNKLQLISGLEILNFSTREAVFLDAGTLLKFPEYPQMRTCSIQEIIAPSSMELQNNWRLTAERREMKAKDHHELLASLEALTAALDVESIRGQLAVRPIQPGDRIHPLGMRGSLKVSDLFINCKILQPARERWPLVVDEEKVVWVVGLRIHDRCRIMPSTKEIILIQAVPPEE
jgi:tRNA(Ile)-lysidine synthase